jgi:hypothetical protein
VWLKKLRTENYKKLKKENPMAGVIWGFHRDGNIGRFLITNVLMD